MGRCRPSSFRLYICVVYWNNPLCVDRNLPYETAYKALTTTQETVSWLSWNELPGANIVIKQHSTFHITSELSMAHLEEADPPEIIYLSKNDSYPENRKTENHWTFQSMLVGFDGFMMFHELLQPVSPSTIVQDAVYRTDQCRQNSLPLGLVFCRLQRPAKPSWRWVEKRKQYSLHYPKDPCMVDIYLQYPTIYQ